MKVLFLLALIATSCYAQTCQKDVSDTWGHVKNVQGDILRLNFDKFFEDLYLIPYDIEALYRDCDECLAAIKNIETTCAQVLSDLKELDFAKVSTDGKVCIALVKNIGEHCPGKSMSQLAE